MLKEDLEIDNVHQIKRARCLKWLRKLIFSETKTTY